ncbi:MAG TPA: hypothetical protein VM344_01925, partial [Vitreimonas sp.]|nr:hypothetical protein [Vitreimonas sp.]
MFIPRTLAEQAGPGRGAVGRALTVAGIIALALFFILSANITLGQENLEVGQIAPRDIRAQRDASFESPSLTQEARDVAADDVIPATETIKSPADNQEDQLLAYDTMSRRVVRILSLRDSGTLGADEVVERLTEDAPSVPFGQRRTVSELPLERWNAIAAAGRAALETSLAGAVREDNLVSSRTAPARL